MVDHLRRIGDKDIDESVLRRYVIRNERIRARKANSSLKKRIRALETNQNGV